MICYRCGEERGEEFYKGTRYCKECYKKRVRAYYADNRETYSAYEKEREQRPERKQQKAEARKRHRMLYPEKYKARTAVGNALRDGRLVRQPCVRCGSKKSQAHHHDYSQPLSVTWLCFRCHRQDEHGQTVISAVK